MAFYFRIDAENRLVTMIFGGEVPFEEWKSAMDGVLADARFKPGFDFLTDWTAADVSLGSTFIDQALAYIRTRSNELGSSRRAVVVKKDYQDELARMGQILNEQEPVGVLETFRDIRKALGWLKSGE